MRAGAARLLDKTIARATIMEELYESAFKDTWKTTRAKYKGIIVELILSFKNNCLKTLRGFIDPRNFFNSENFQATVRSAASIACHLYFQFVSQKPTFRYFTSDRV